MFDKKQTWIDMLSVWLGTTIIAKNLFKNLPVRKQYHNAVKKKKDDMKNVENILIAYGLILPQVRFSLRHNKDLIWQKLALDTSAAVLQSILSKPVMTQMEKQTKADMDIGVMSLLVALIRFAKILL